MSTFDTRYKFAEFVFEPARNLLVGPQSEVVLEQRIASLLEAFCLTPHEIITKEQLLDKVWADRVVSEDSLTVAISKLRKVLQDSRGEPKFIKTIAGVGYQWLPDVSEEQPSAPVHSNTSPEIVDAQRNRYYSQKYAIIAISLVLITIVVATSLWNQLSAPFDTPTHTEAVMPAELQQRYDRANALVLTLNEGLPAREGATPRQTLLEAIEIYREVIKKYPTILTAYVGLGEAKYMLSELDVHRELKVLRDEILALADFVIAQDPDHALAWLLRARIMMLGFWNLDDAEAAYAKVIELDPKNSLAAISYGELLAIRGRTKEAQQLFSEMRNKYPELYQYVSMSIIYMFDHQYNKALAELQRLVNTERESRSHDVMLHRIALLTGDDELAMTYLEAIMNRQKVSSEYIAECKQVFSGGGIKAVFNKLIDDRIETNLGHYTPPISWARYAVSPSGIPKPLPGSGKPTNNTTRWY